MRRPRFRLRTLMIAVAVAALGLSARVAWDRLDDERQQKLLIEAWRLCWNLPALIVLPSFLALVILVDIVPLVNLGTRLVRVVRGR